MDLENWNLKRRLLSNNKLEYKFTIVYCESVNLIGYITADRKQFLISAHRASQFEPDVT